MTINLKKMEFSLKSPVHLDIEDVWSGVRDGLIAIWSLILYFIITIFNFISFGILGFVMDWKNVKRNKKLYRKYEGYEIIFFGKKIYEKREKIDN